MKKMPEKDRGAAPGPRSTNMPISTSYQQPVPQGQPPPPLASSTTNSTTHPTPPMPAVPPYSFSSGVQYWTVAPCTASSQYGTVLHGVMPPAPKPKSVVEAYILALPLGILGAHHFYLGRAIIGVMYFFTFGLFGVGVVFDLLRMPCLVAQVNKANRERYEQLQSLQLQVSHQQQQMLLSQPSMPQQRVMYLPFERKSLLDAYILWFPCGLLGFHYFYLRKPFMGTLYLITLGLLGLGWLVDLFRMPSLVREANTPTAAAEQRYSQCSAHILAISPPGLLGFHHYYLDRPVWGILYTFTLGLLGVGWVFDWFRTNCLVRRANAIKNGLISRERKYLDDAYILCIPFGFLGLHHFYLGRHCWGVLYFFTFGILGIGWLVDWFRLPCLVRECNADAEASQRLIVTTPSPALTSVASCGGGMHASQTHPPVYPGYSQQGPVHPGVGYNGPYASSSGQYGTGMAGASAQNVAEPDSGVVNEGFAPPSYEAAVRDGASTQKQSTK